MKTLLRVSGLALLLSLTAFTLAQSAPAPFGTCRTFCTGGGSFTTVIWTTSQSQCCSLSANPCPAGMTPGGATFQPAGGLARFCGPIDG